jgi:phospholipid/cholesterol/gamma-HCH transport system substrate-binding protein
MKILRNINWMELSGLLVGALLAAVICVFGVVLYAKLMQEGLIGVNEYRVYSDFLSGQGLHKGTKVQINGVEVGKVSNLELTEGGRVRLEFTIRTEYKNWITDSASAYATRDQNVISERVVNIDISQKGQVLDEGGILQAGTAQDIETVLRTANELIDRIGKLVIVADTLLKRVTDTNTTVGIMLGSRRLYDKLEDQLGKVDGLTSDLDRITGQTNALLGTANRRLPGVFDSADTLTADVMKLSGNLDILSGRALGLIGSLDTTAAKMNGMVDDLRRMTGEAGSLISDGTHTLRRADDLMNGVSKFWFIRDKIPQKDTIPLLVEEPW